MKKVLSRRNTIKIFASAIATFPINVFAEKNLHNYYWQSSALGNLVNMQLITKDNSHLKRLLMIIDSEINRFNKIFYLQDASSQINILNKIIVKKRFIDSYLGTKLFQLNTNQEDILSDDFKKKFYNFFNKINLKKYDAIVIFDYGHGLINSNIINYHTLNIKNINTKIQI